MDQADKEGFVKIPPGDAKDDEPPAFLDTSFPKVHFGQGNESTCLLSSFASAVFFLGMRDEAHEIMKYRDQSVGISSGRIGHLNRLVQDYLPHHEAHHLNSAAQAAGLCVVNEKGTGLCEASLPRPWSIVVLVPTGRISEYGIGHCITCVGDMAFDSNLPNAFKLTKSSLDWVVGGKYEKVNQATVIVPTSKKFRHNICHGPNLAGDTMLFVGFSFPRPSLFASLAVGFHRYGKIKLARFLLEMRSDAEENNLRVLETCLRKKGVSLIKTRMDIREMANRSGLLLTKFAARKYKDEKSVPFCVVDGMVCSSTLMRVVPCCKEFLYWDCGTSKISCCFSYMFSFDN